MDVVLLTQVEDVGSLCIGIALCHQTLLVAQTEPVLIAGGGGIHIFCQLDDAERQGGVVPQRAPVAHQFAQQVGIGSGIARIGLALIPHHATEGIGSQGIEHGIVEGGRHVLQRHIATGAGRHLRSGMMAPLGTQRDDVLGHGILAVAVGTKGKQIGLVLNEVDGAVLVDKPDGDDIVTLAEQSFGNVVAARRILVVGASHLLSVDIGEVGIKQRT